MKDRHHYHDPEDEAARENRAEMDAERGDRQYDEMIENRIIEELESRDTGFSSDTPETDALGYIPTDIGPCWALVEHARRLERRLNDALARIKAMEESKTDSLK